MARYSVLHENRQLLAAKYLTYLPSVEELQHELRQERRLLEARGVGAHGVQGNRHDHLFTTAIATPAAMVVGKTVPTPGISPARLNHQPGPDKRNPSRFP